MERTNQHAKVVFEQVINFLTFFFGRTITEYCFKQLPNLHYCDLSPYRLTQFYSVIYTHVSSRCCFPELFAEKQDIKTGLKDVRLFRRRYHLGAAVRQSVSA